MLVDRRRLERTIQLYSKLGQQLLYLRFAVEAERIYSGKWAAKNVLAVSKLVEKHLVERFAANPESLRTMDRRLFEELIAEVFHRFGYDVRLTARTRDGGYDVVAVAPKDASVRYLVECKRPDPGNKIGVDPIRALYGVKNFESATGVILATTSYFSRDARRLVEKSSPSAGSTRSSWDFELRDYDGVVDWIMRTSRSG
jgi:restriction endonuclease Mrr